MTDDLPDTDGVNKAEMHLEDIAYDGDREYHITAAVDNLNATPNTDLRETAELWRAMAGNAPEQNATTLRWCADQLEDLADE